MTSDCAGDQISQESADSNSVQAASTIGGHDRLNEAPRDWIMLELACDPDVVGSWDRYTIASVCQEALNALRGAVHQS